MVTWEVIWEKANWWSKVPVLIQGWKQPKENGRERETAVKSLLPYKVMENTWFKGAISEVKRWQRGRQAWNLAHSFPLKFPPLCRIQSAILVWRTLPFHGNGLPAPLILEPTLCPELAPLLIFQYLSRICKTSVHCCFRMGSMTPELQHKPNIEEASQKAIWKYISVKKSILGIKISAFLFICMVVNIAFWNYIKNKTVLPFYL